MSICESRVSVAGRSEGEHGQTPEIALKRLERASTINTNTPTSVSLWDLTKPSESEKHRITREKFNKPFRERVIGADDRCKVPRKDFGPRGKYRFVCKLVGQYKENQDDTHVVALHGTGWLIAEDLVVTAGHVIYDSNDKWGGLSSMKVYIGYNGDDTPDREYRYGKFVAVPTEWLKDSNAKYDVGFIKLNRPFENVNPIQFMTTPAIGKEEFIGVVGYPCDREDGEHMFEHFLSASWNLAMADRSMLEYSIDTFGGQSGAAVLRHPSGACADAPKQHQCQLRSIGVHAYGGTRGEPNEASVIGTNGSVFEDFVLAVKVRSDPTFKVKVSRSPGLSQLPKFSTLTVNPAGSTVVRQLTPNDRPQKSRHDASISRDRYLPSDPAKWTDDQLDWVQQALRMRNLMESSVGSADERGNNQSEKDPFTFGHKDDLSKGP